MPILSKFAFRNAIPECSTLWKIGHLIFKARRDDELLWHQSLFCKGDPIEIERFVIEEFGFVKALTSIGLGLYENSTARIRYGRYLTGAASDLSQRLLFGGREFSRPGTYNAVYHIDRNSAYPACCIDLGLPVPYFMRMKKDVPVASAIRIVEKHNGYGFFKLSLSQDIPIQGVLPIDRGCYRYPDRAGQTIEGVWTFNELRYALEWGYRIEKAHWLFSSPVSIPYLSQFQSDMWEMRQKFGDFGDGIGKSVCKAIANKTIGRLASLSRGMIVYSQSPGGGVRMYGGEWEKKEFTPPHRANRVHAAYVSAEQRCVLHRALVTSVNPVYGFTDSLVCEKLPPVTIGKGLGEWKLYHSEPGRYVVRGLGQFASRDRVANRGRWLNKTSR